MRVSSFRNWLSVSLLAALTAAQIVPAAAQSAPDLVGVWKGTAMAVGIGPTPYRSAEAQGPVFFDQPQEYTYTITGQDRGRLIGKMTSRTGAETLIGALQPPEYKQGILLDDDGRNTFTVRDATTLDVCYDHLYPKSKVVACFTLKKQ